MVRNAMQGTMQGHMPGQIQGQVQGQIQGQIQGVARKAMSRRRHYVSLATQALALAGLLRVLLLAPSLQPETLAPPLVLPSTMPAGMQPGVQVGTAALAAQDCAQAPSGQIHYEQAGAVYFCTLQTMFAMLAAPEQPGFVQTSLVRAASAASTETADGLWIAASRAVYVLRRGASGGAPAVLAAFVQPHHARAYARAQGGELLSYRQMLARSLTLTVGEARQGLVKKA